MARLRDALKQARSNWARHAVAVRERKRATIGYTALLALPPPDSEALDTCAEEEATAA